MSTSKRYVYVHPSVLLIYISFSSRCRRDSCPAVLSTPMRFGAGLDLIPIQNYQHLQIHAHKCGYAHGMKRSKPCRRSTFQLQKEGCHQTWILVHTNEGEKKVLNTCYLEMWSARGLNTWRQRYRTPRRKTCDTPSHTSPARRNRGREE